jgi:hypothetical protein
MASGAAGANKRGRESHPPPGTRVWVGAPPPESLHCSICTDVFKEVRACALHGSGERVPRQVCACETLG